MNEPLLQLSAGGIFAILVLRLVLDHLAKRKDDREGRAHSAGEQSVEFWKVAINEALTGCLETSVHPILRRQTEILNELARSAIAHGTEQLRAQLTLNEIEKAQGRLHTHVNDLKERVGEAAMLHRRGDDRA